ncbi:MAG: ATP-binding protein [Marinilabiliaceae bacterium]|nr:ATP-binding protein [Marinilabiliaceae bacterium]
MGKYNIGQHARLVVKDVRKEESKMYYIVSDGEKEYSIGVFRFQEQMEVPKTLDCIVKEIHHDQVIWTQDFEPIVKSYYEVDKVYSFAVEDDYRNPISLGYYTVHDGRFFKFRLTLDQTGGIRLRPREKVLCKVVAIDGWKLILRLCDNNGLPISKDNGQHKKTSVKEDKKPEEVTPNREFITLDEVVAGAGIDASIAKLLKGYMHRRPEFDRVRKAYRNENATWVIMALGELADSMVKCVMAFPHNKHRLLNAMRSVALFLLEESDLLRNADDDEREDSHRLLSSVVDEVEVTEKALGCVDRGEEQDWMDHVLNCLRLSGYLHHPEEKLKIMMCLLSLRSDLQDLYMGDIFDIITGGKERDWHVEPFRGAMVRMLEMYIAAAQYRVNMLSNAETKEGRNLIQSVVRALSIELFLSVDADGIERRCRKAMLCRLLTYTEGFNMIDDLLHRSLDSICFPYDSRLEYGWDDLSHTETIAFKLCKGDDRSKLYAGRMMELEQSDVQLRLIGKTILIRNRWSERQRNVLPEGLFPAMDVQITISKDESVEMDSGMQVPALKRAWSEIEANIFTTLRHVTPSFSEDNNEPAEQSKIYPQVGDEVPVFVTAIERIPTSDVIDKYVLKCEIYSDTFIGRGELDMSQLVQFYVVPSKDDFIDQTTGRPMRFSVEIEREETPGFYTFTARKAVGRFFQEYTDFENRERMKCKIKSTIKGNKFLCLDQYGRSVLVSKTESLRDLNNGAYLILRAESISPTAQVIGSFEAEINDYFTDKDIFRNFMDWYKLDVIPEPTKEVEDEIYYPSDEPEQSAFKLEECYVREIILIMDRLAVSSTEQSLTYNYLSLAHLLSRIIGDERIEKYYKDRKRIVELLYDYALNRNIDDNEVQNLAKGNGDLIGHDTAFNEYLTRLRIIGAKGQENQNKFLWDTYKETQSTTIRDIASLMLSRNMLDSFGLLFAKEKESIVKQISEILHIAIPEKQLKYFGEEDQTREYKSSLVIPAGSLTPDEKKQKRHIMERLCAMLNTEGGILYIGVNNQGFAAGLDADMTYFRSLCVGPTEDPVDKFTNCFQEAAFSMLGTQPAQYVEYKMDEVDGRQVFEISVKPYPEPVSIGGKFFVRYGATTREVTSAAEIHNMRAAMERANGMSTAAKSGGK